MDTAFIQLLGVGATLLITGANAAFFCVIKFNDMIHLGKKVDELTNSINKLIDKVEKNDTDISVIQAVCKERHPQL